jgi:hypothetical protein
VENKRLGAALVLMPVRSARAEQPGSTHCRLPLWHPALTEPSRPVLEHYCGKFGVV